MDLPTPIHPRVLHIIHNPRIPSAGGEKLNRVFGWNDPDQNARGYIQDIRAASYGYANYRIVERIEIDGFPQKKDGFRYLADQYAAYWRSRKGFHQADQVDYHLLVHEFDVIRKIQKGTIDEVWLSAFPYAGYFESRMAGPNAFWCNAPPLEGTEESRKKICHYGVQLRTRCRGNV